LRGRHGNRGRTGPKAGFLEEFPTTGIDLILLTQWSTLLINRGDLIVATAGPRNTAA
jgi:hypothetical protein